MRKAFLIAVLAGGLAALAAATAQSGSPGFKTAQGPMIDAVAPGATYEPIITVGDTVDGYMFESIPDGIALSKNGQGTVDLYVNHETSMVPFPLTPTVFNDFTNAMVSKLRLHQKSGGVLEGSYTIGSAANWQRFCSNFIASQEHGFERDLVLTNEEGIDWVNRTGEAWPATIGAPEARQIGAVVAIDEKSGESRPIWGMGRLNHENSVAVPGYGKPVVITGDDAFVNNPVQSQVYSYIADSANAVWNDQGDLWAFVSTTPGFNDYFDFTPGSPVSIQGRFVKVPKNIATGRNPDGTDMMAADAGYSPPPNDGSWQRDPNGVGIDGPQWVLESWSDANDAFQFVRIEDTAYDKRPGMQNVQYLVDSGRGTAGSPQPGRSTNGRIWKMVLDPADPTKVLSLSILVDGDTLPVKHLGAIHQPDNIESTQKGLLVTEDPGSSQQFNPTDAGATTARLMHYRFATGLLSEAARVNQSADEGPTDVDSNPAPGRLGAWEASGIVDASSVFGPDTFLIDVQAGTLVIKEEVRGNITYQRDGGQLGLLRIPGA